MMGATLLKVGGEVCALLNALLVSDVLAVCAASPTIESRLLATGLGIDDPFTTQLLYISYIPYRSSFIRTSRFERLSAIQLQHGI